MAQQSPHFEPVSIPYRLLAEIEYRQIVFYRRPDFEIATLYCKLRDVVKFVPDEETL